ncbi:MAG: type IV secretory system conjugative DNA transfer family protein [Pleurocapsa sp. SU_196_0]|nr:type IV secretory system conjugative DNA transfer family protein [Pleurocapsa sp. SU_196_0]
MTIHYPLFLLRVFAVFVCVYLAAVAFFLPGASSLGFVMLGVGLAVLLVTYGLGARHRTLYDAHWATKAEVKPFVTTLEHSSREVLLGYAFGQLVAMKPGAFGRRELGHFLIVGPPRSGKSLSARCNLLSWGGSAIVVDLKGELYHATAGYRERVLGQRVFVIRPSDIKDVDSLDCGKHLSHRYDPFSELKSDEFIRAVATGLLDPASNGDNAMFALRAINALFAGIKAAHILGQPVLPFVQELTGYGFKAFCLELYKIPDEPLRRAIRDFLNADPLTLDWDNIPDAKFLANAWANMTTKLQYLFTPATLRVTSGSDFKASEFFEQPTTVYLSSTNPNSRRAARCFKPCSAPSTRRSSVTPTRTRSVNASRCSRSARRRARSSYRSSTSGWPPSPVAAFRLPSTCKACRSSTMPTASATPRRSRTRRTRKPFSRRRTCKSPASTSARSAGSSWPRTRGTA